MHQPSTNFSDAIALLRNASRVVILSGAGLSKASGISTYRDAGGLWQTEAVKYASIDGYAADPAGFSRFWRERQRELSRARPNAAHQALSRLQAQTHTALVTQNVDGLLQEAGCTGVIELHGSLRRTRCSECASKRPALLGRCLRCGGRMRPDAVLFGEELDGDVLSLSQEAAKDCDLFLVVGTTALVYPAADLPIRALRGGAKLMVIDPELPLLATTAHVALAEKAEEALPRLVAAACEGPAESKLTRY